MIKVYEVSRKYIMLFVHNNRYLPLTGLLCCSELYSPHPQSIEKFLKYFRNISQKNFMKYFTPKIFMKFYVTTLIATDVSVRDLSVCLSHSCTLLKPLDGMKCHLAGTLLWYKLTLYQTVPHPTRRAESGDRNSSSQRVTLVHAVSSELNKDEEQEI